MSPNHGLRRFTIAVFIVYATLNLYTVLAPLIGLPSHYMLTPVLTLLAFIFALSHSVVSFGWPRAMLLLVVTLLVSLSVESIGVVTGWIFGPYHYTPKLGPRVLGLVPLMIPVAWYMMLYPSLRIAQSLVADRLSKPWQSLLAVAVVGATVMTAWDVVMDPLMVRLGFWVWDVEGAYFGVPMQNYLGWFVTAWCVLVLYGVLLPKPGRQPAPSTTAGFARMAPGVYLITWLFNSVAVLRLGMGGVAVAGAFGMGALGVLGLLSQRGGEYS